MKGSFFVIVQARTKKLLHVTSQWRTHNAVEQREDYDILPDAEKDNSKTSSTTGDYSSSFVL